MTRRANTAEQNRIRGVKSQVGVNRHAPASAQPSVYMAGRPKISKALSKEGKAEFKRVCKFLEDRRTLAEADYYAIFVLAECWARYLAAKSALGTNFIITTTVQNKKGEPFEVEKENSLVKIVEACEARLLTLSKALGLSPDSRDKVKQLQDGPGEREVIPGSVEDMYPECFGKKPEPETLLFTPVAVPPEEMFASDPNDEKPEETDVDGHMD